MMDKSEKNDLKIKKEAECEIAYLLQLKLHMHVFTEQK